MTFQTQAHPGTKCGNPNVTNMVWEGGEVCHVNDGWGEGQCVPTPLEVSESSGVGAILLPLLLPTHFRNTWLPSSATPTPSAGRLEVPPGERPAGLPQRPGFLHRGLRLHDVHRQQRGAAAGGPRGV